MNLNKGDQVQVNYYGISANGVIDKIRSWYGMEYTGELAYYVKLDFLINKGTVLESDRVFINPSSLSRGSCCIEKQ